MWPSGCVRCGETSCASYIPNTCECASCPPGWRLAGSVCTEAEEAEQLLDATVVLGGAVPRLDTVYQLQANCTAARYLSARPCDSEDCGLSIQRAPSESAQSRVSDALRFFIRPSNGTSAMNPLFSSPVQIVSTLREATPDCPARLGVGSAAVKAVAELGSQPQCGRWVVGMHDGPSPTAHQWVLEPADLDLTVRIRAEGLPQTCARYLGVHAACATGLEPQLFAADDPNAITEWRLLRLP
ncbi:hypothetical protein COHA_003875 [Chlorella ohadii]|uniref:Uncharacterized protein n=1 Tax=Chlorella ohadii TaxID=2649997 RepID=A0AAD5DUI9_9CHLO|nr:hypothetical protein COHA_003875 [Chlorella ohadii]